MGESYVTREQMIDEAVRRVKAQHGYLIRSSRSVPGHPWQVTIEPERFAQIRAEFRRIEAEQNIRYSITELYDDCVVTPSGDRISHEEYRRRGGSIPPQMVRQAPRYGR